MKKILLSLILLFSVSAIFAQYNNTPYDFPIKSGSEKWQSFKSVQDMYKACQIPIDTLSNLSTKALVQTCLNYPAPSILLIHNTPQQGLNEWKQHFNGIDELFIRSDAKEELINTYKSFNIKGYEKLKTDIEKGKYTFQLQMLEAIIAQEEIIGKLNESQKKQILKTCLSNYQLIEADQVYGFTNLESTGRIIIKLANSLGNQSIKEKIQSKDIQEFINTGFLSDRETFLQIISEAKKVDTNE